MTSSISLCTTVWMKRSKIQYKMILKQNSFYMCIISKSNTVWVASEGETKATLLRRQSPTFWYSRLIFATYLFGQVTRPHLIYTIYKVNSCSHALCVRGNVHFPKVIWDSKGSYFNCYRFWHGCVYGLTPWVSVFPFIFVLWMNHGMFPSILQVLK
jgi:hypothetical protein